MKYIKACEIFEKYDFYLIPKLEKFKVKNYTINDDQIIDVNGGVYLWDKKLENIPFQFGKVNGCFYCSDNELTSLKGSPIEIGDNFDCSRNQLTSLEYCPSEIGRDFDCSNNKLTMLDCSSYVKGNIICWGMFKQEPEFFGDCEGEVIWRS